jgi:transcriptional regulator with XRE-family HTH domain
MTREELIKSQEYWIVTIQTELFNHVRLYLEENKMTQTQFAAKMGVSKGYISQIMNGNFNHSLSKLIELSLAIGKMPVLKFESFDTKKESFSNQMLSPSA